MIGSAALLWVLRTRQRAALDAVLGVEHGALVGGLRRAQALHADGQPLAVHHGEHGAQALVRLADQPAGRLVEAHLAGGGGLDAHLVLDGGADHAVARARAAVLVRAGTSAPGTG